MLINTRVKTAASGRMFKPLWQHGRAVVTGESNQVMVDIHDRRCLVLQPDSIREWLSEDTSSERASEIAHKCALLESDFDWHKVDNAVGNIHNQGKVLTEPV